MNRFLRDILAPLRSTVLHPQWLTLRHEERHLQAIRSRLNGRIVDLGCADKKILPLLPDDCEYIGLDYYETAVGWYGTVPDLFGDAQQLPFANQSVDHVLLLDVLEHLPRPDACLAEIYRVLKPGGTLFISVPFLYPIHDAPLDFTRWTQHGLRELARKHGFTISQELSANHPVATAALLGNLALGKTTIDFVAEKSPLALLGALIPPIVVALNLLGWFTDQCRSEDPFMASNYRTIWVKE